MKYDDLNLKRIREVPIFDVCSKLGISLYGMGKITKRATCWYHDDKHPSMHVNKKKNIYKCFVCGKGGDVIRLVQDYENLSFVEACDWLVREFRLMFPKMRDPSAAQDKLLRWIKMDPRLHKRLLRLANSKDDNNYSKEQIKLMIDKWGEPGDYDDY